MTKPRTPMETKTARNLPLLRKTTSSVSKSKLETRTSRHLRMSHGLSGGRQIQRMDKRDWENRMGEILKLLEHHRYSRNNALHYALSNVKMLMADMEKKKADMETYMEELQASNEEMRATNEEMRILQMEVERTHQDTEGILSKGPEAFEAPLGKIRAYALGLKETRGDQLDPEANEHLIYMAEQAGRMEDTFNGLLGYWRVDMEGNPFKTVDCESILNQVEKNLKNLTNSAGAEITRDPLPAVNGDRDQIALLFRILLKRAVSSPGASSPRIHISATPGGEGDKASDQGDMAVEWDFRVEDNGDEIPEKDRKRIFMPLPDGAMDLAIAWRIVNRHGGEITVAPGKDGGNVFQFSLFGH